MNDFSISEMRDSAILALLDMKNLILENPDYQRPGGVWSPQKRQLFIDSLINGYDIPKIYLHALPEIDAEGHKFAIVDGRQRLEAIWDFADDKFPLAGDFDFFSNPDVQASGMKYSDLIREHPRLVTKFHARTLSIIVIATSDIDVVEDMFSRLNQAEPLNAAEKRNAFGGKLPSLIRDLALCDFFTSRVKISSSRYRHHDIATKMIYLQFNSEIVDTKKSSLDIFVKNSRFIANTAVERLVEGVQGVLTQMANIFWEKDTLLRSSGMIVVYYVLFSRLAAAKLSIPARDNLVLFEELRAENRRKFEQGLPDIDLRLIEYDELAQSSNDASAIRTRYELLKEYTIKIAAGEITRDTLGLDF